MKVWMALEVARNHNHLIDRVKCEISIRLWMVKFQEGDPFYDIDRKLRLVDR